MRFRGCPPPAKQPRSQSQPGPFLCLAPNSETEPLLSWKKAQETVPWNIILLLGGGFAMAKGCEVRAGVTWGQWTR